MQFKRCEKNPIVPRTPGTFRSIFTANPDILFFQGRYHFYFRGQGEEKHDQIGVAYSSPGSFDGINWEMFAGNPVIRVGENVSDIDSGHILDPGSVVFNNKVYLYYTAYSINSKIGSATGLAISDNGTDFQKKAGGPIVPGIAPEAVVNNGRIYLFNSHLSDEGFFQIHCFVSDDDYGGCGTTAFSQIGLATWTGELPNW